MKCNQIRDCPDNSDEMSCRKIGWMSGMGWEDGMEWDEMGWNKGVEFDCWDRLGLKR